MVAGVIAAAAADEIFIAHPGASAEVATVAVILGGPLVYLLGTALYQRALGGGLPISRLVAAGVLVALTPLGFAASVLVLGTLALLVIAGVALADLTLAR
jgi:low temperature requirement protein LtrA